MGILNVKQSNLFPEFFLKCCRVSKRLLFQDPLLRRIEGAQLIPPGSILPPRIPANRISLWFHNFRFAAKKIVVFSRVLFPGVFAVFNFLYWAYFLTVEQDN